MTPWEHFHHVADIGVRGVGATLAEAFEQAALAMTAVVCDPLSVKPETQVSIACSAPDVELLLVDWLNCLIYEMAVRHMLFSRFQVAINEKTLTGAAWGEPADREHHAPAVEVKGATYTGLSVTQSDRGIWIAQCVVDV